MSYCYGDIESYTQFIKTNPLDAEAYYERGGLYSLEENYDAALADFNQAIQLDPGNAWYYMSRASTHLQKQNHAEAVADYTEALRLAPDNVGLAESALFYRAGEYRWFENFDAAIADYTAWMQIKPQARLRGLMFRAYTWRLKGDLQNALKDANEILSLDPANVEAVAFRALCKAESGDLAGAEADYSEAIRFNPNYPAYHLFLRGNIRADRGNLVGAKADHDEVLRLAPEHEGMWVHFRRCQEALKQRCYEEALRYINMLLAIEPDGLEYRVTRGSIFTELGDSSRANLDYDFVINQANELIPKWNGTKPAQAFPLAWLYQVRGRAQAGRGHVQEAIADYQQALALKAKFQRVLEDVAPMEDYIQSHQDKK